jgi:anaerobic magnesium-protoporphyrin IX monomethyl ester cyclase
MNKINHKEKDFKILLINPPVPADGAKFIREGRCQQEMGIWTTVWPPISLAISGSILKDKGYRIKIVDCPIENVTWSLLTQVIKLFKPDFVISSISTPTLESDLDIVKLSKGINNKIKIAVFGVHVTEIPDDAFKISKDLDFVIRGEPEITASCLSDAIFNGSDFAEIKGISFRMGNDIINNPDRIFIEDLDSLPYPAWTDIDINRYRLPISGDRFLNAIPHRGCPFNCIFCASKPYYGKKTRFRTPAKFVDELEWVKSEFGVKNFLFWAETYTISKDFVMNVDREIIAHKLGIKWVCNSRVDTIDEEMMMSMKEAGCWMIGYGIESSNQKILDMAGKKIRVEKIRETISLTKKVGLTTTGHVIIGLPGETKETVMETINFVNSLPLDFAQFYTASPWPGTELYRYTKSKGLLKTENFRDYTQQKGVIETDTFSANDVTKYTKLAYRKFYFRPKVFAKMLKRVATFQNLKYTLMTTLSYFFKGKSIK